MAVFHKRYQDRYLFFHIAGVRLHLAVAKLQLMQPHVTPYPHIFLAILENGPHRGRKKPAHFIRAHRQMVEVDPEQAALPHEKEKVALLILEKTRT